MKSRLWETSKLKTDTKGFNDLPSKKEVRRMFKELEDAGVKVMFIDLFPEQYPYWKNCNDTAVFSIIKRSAKLTGLQAGLMVAGTGHKLGVDELNSKIILNRTIIRFWWD